MKMARRANLEAHRHRRRFGRAQKDAAVSRLGPTSKLPATMCCKVCGVVYGGGRWHWAPKPANAQPCECPACQRIRHRAPAGMVRLSGGSVVAFAEEMKQLAQHQEEAEKAEHPLNRIMAIDANAQGLIILTTDIHLPRRIGQAIRRAFRGALRVKFGDEGDFVTVEWTSPVRKKEQ